MTELDFGITEAGNPTHYNRNEQVGTLNGKPVLAQVVLAGAMKRTYLGVQSLVLSGVAQSLTVPAGTTLADIYAEETGTPGAGVARYWHGATPTAAIGKRLKDHEEIGSAAPANFLAILQAGGITLRVEYASNS
jgi:hypothetical protein